MSRLPIAYRTPSLRVWPDFGTELDRLFDGLNRRSVQWPPRAPAADFYETSDAYVLELDAPGFETDDIDVSFENGLLTVTGSHRAETEEEGRTYHVRERAFETFTRTFSLPETVRADEVSAGLDEGVLTVTLPKAPDAKPRRIDVTAGRTHR
jgi:HSP20 family protein